MQCEINVKCETPHKVILTNTSIKAASDIFVSNYLHLSPTTYNL